MAAASSPKLIADLKIEFSEIRLFFSVIDLLVLRYILSVSVYVNLLNFS